MNGTKLLIRLADNHWRKCGLPAPAACSIGRAFVPYTRPALRARPERVEHLDPFERRFYFARSGPTAAGMRRDVQRGADIRFQMFEDGLDGLQLRLGVLFERATKTDEQFADFPSVVGLPAPERARLPQCCTHPLQQLLA